MSFRLSPACMVWRTPTAFAEKVVHLEKGMRIDRDKLLRRFVDALYVNNKIEFNRGCFRVNGDTVDIFPAIETFDGAAYRIEFWDDEVDRISSFDPQTGQEIDEQDELNICLLYTSPSPRDTR